MINIDFSSKMNNIRFWRIPREDFMNVHVKPRMTEADAKRIAISIIPELQKHAAKAEELRQLPRESVDLLIDNGLLQTIQPASCGGHEISMRAHMDVMSSVAYGCGATAWVLGVWQAHSWMFGHANEKFQKDVFSDGGDHPVSAVIGPRGKAVRKADGTYTLSGFWPFASGNAHVEWLLLGAEVRDEAGNMVDMGDLLVERKQLDIVDDWHVAGLQGTGSNSVKCKDIVVPAHRFLSLAALLDHQTTPYTDPNAPAVFKSQAAPVLGLCIASGATGIARSALDEFLKVVPGKAVMYTAHISHEWQPLQRILGEAAAKIHAAELILYRVADDIDAYAKRGEKMPIDVRGRIRMDICLAPRLCRDAVQELMTIGGAAGLSLKSPIQRAFRNLQATCMHGFLLYDAGAEIYGKILLGQDPGTPVV
jgi:3-hydroxy-9,10-secoandrosta-1,3,5(10)-triene-9,17-dione monooxygenase